MQCINAKLIVVLPEPICVSFVFHPFNKNSNNLLILSSLLKNIELGPFLMSTHHYAPVLHHSIKAKLVSEVVSGKTASTNHSTARPSEER